ncbi:MAG: hypothetical protein VX984_02105 [Thermodesulfobacteriota bacterium]|nr:hypothetical protein [Thermodesulfobacteriota bacterium]
MSQFSYDELKNLFDKDKVHFYQSSLGILELEGKDCEKFLNGISTNDSSMKIQHNLILTNKGRILFDMSIFNQEKIYIITNALQVQDLIDYLNKYKMSYQVNIENLSDKFIALKGTHLKINNNMIWKSPIFLEEDLDVAIVAKDHKLPESKKIGEEDYFKWKIIHGIPSFPNEINNKIIPIESNMWSTISFTKGCYVGQETIATIRYRGKVPRTLACMSINGNLENIEELTNKDRKSVGRITSRFFSEKDNMTFALGFINQEENFDGNVVYNENEEILVRKNLYQLNNLETIR